MGVAMLVAPMVWVVVRTSRVTSRPPRTWMSFGVVGDGLPGAVGALELGVAAGAAEVFDVEVLDVGAEVGEAPGDVGVVADDDEGDAGEGDAGDVRRRVGVPESAWRAASYQMPGTVRPRCMSLERRGLPEAVWEPATTQLLEPERQASQWSGGER